MTKLKLIRLSLLHFTAKLLRIPIRVADDFWMNGAGGVT